MVLAVREAPVLLDGTAVVVPGSRCVRAGGRSGGVLGTPRGDPCARHRGGRAGAYPPEPLRRGLHVA